ncbi:hypothetical protein [Streptomyces sp. NPDC057686]|uniref:hypothetical protein n=1 Tax=Streptomyces sp. NPDC057686 TaxID=3346212 RepID=UPI003688F535
MQKRDRTMFISGWRSRSAWYLVALCALSAPLVTGCAAESREDVLKAFDLELPTCQTENVTFSGQTSWPGTNLKMSFTAAKSCVEQYLTDHQVDLSNPIYWPAAAENRIGDNTFSPTRPPFEADAMEQFKLKLDPSKRYEMYIDFRTPKKAQFSVLLVPQGDQVSVFMASDLTGDIGKRG